MLNISCQGEDEKTFRSRRGTKEEIKKSTMTMLRNVISLSQILNPIPGNSSPPLLLICTHYLLLDFFFVVLTLSDRHYITMKLTYYDERTPPEYQPKFFVDSTGGKSYHLSSVSRFVSCVPSCPIHLLGDPPDARIRRAAIVQ